MLYNILLVRFNLYQRNNYSTKAGIVQVLQNTIYFSFYTNMLVM